MQLALTLSNSSKASPKGSIFPYFHLNILSSIKVLNMNLDDKDQDKGSSVMEKIDSYVQIPYFLKLPVFLTVHPI